MSRNGYSKLVDSSSNGEYATNDREESRKKKRSKQHGASGSTEHSTLMGQVQNVKSKKVYVFSDGTMADTENERIELSSMSQRGQSGSSQRSYKSTSSNQYEDIITKEIPLQKTDTLQGLSIKFRCSIPEIKRINGLYTDQEFHALTSIKIPVRSHQRILQQELEEVVKERVNGSGDLLATTKTRCAADIVSSETSEDEEARQSVAQGTHSVMDMVELHSDPDDEESYALLDREWTHKKHSKSTDRDKRKFDKILNRKDEQLKTLAEKVQRQTDAAENVTSLMADSAHLTHVPRKQNCLSTETFTTRCMVGVCLSIIVIPLLFAIIFMKFNGLLNPSSSSDKG